jgi:hypothetical protein
MDSINETFYGNSPYNHTKPLILMSLIKQLPGLIALAAMAIAIKLLAPQDPNVIYAIDPVTATAAISLGSKVVGGIFGGFRRRRRRRRMERSIEQALQESLTGVQLARRGAIQGQLAARGLQSETQERQLETLQQEALAASGGAQAGLDPAQLEALIRGQALSNLAIDASIADQLTTATQRAALAEGKIRAAATLEKAAGREEASKETDEALGSIFESGGALLGGLFK